MTENRLTTRKLYSLGFVAVFLLGIFAALPIAEAAAGPAPTILTTERDYTTPAAIIFGAVGTVYVVVTHTDSDKTDQRDVLRTVTASHASKTVTFDLLETGPHTAKFIGSFQINPAITDVVPATAPAPYGADVLGLTNGDGVLPGTPGGGVIVLTIASTARTAPDGTALTWAPVTRQITWIPSEEHTLAAFSNVEQSLPHASVRAPGQGAPIPGWEYQMYFELRDKDRNRNPAAADTAILFAWSDSDATGESLTLTETAINTPEGIFKTTLGFESALSAQSNSRVFVRPGDKVYVNYIDERDENGVEDVPRPFVYPFTAQSDGFIGWSNPIVSGFYPDFTPPAPPVQSVIGTRNRATLFVSDLDQDIQTRSEAVFVQMLVPAVGTTPENLLCRARLEQNGGVPGIYSATIFFSAAVEPAVGTSDCQNLSGATIVPLGLDAEERTTIVGRYADENRNDIEVDRDASTTWVPAVNATLALGGSALPQRFAGASLPIGITLTDMDSDVNPSAADTVTVKVRSDTDPRGGINVLLSESAATSGTFSGSFSLARAPDGVAEPVSTGTTLFVRDRDFLQATFEDPSGSESRPLTVRSEEAVWREPKEAKVSTDDTQYFYARRTAARPDEAICDLNTAPVNLPPLPCHPETFARVFVEDQDQNDPRVRDTIHVQASRGDVSNSGAGITLREVGVDSGLFEGVLLFTENINDPDPNRLFVGDLTGDGQRQFTIVYDDPVGKNGALTSTKSPNLLWRHITNANVRVVRMEALETWPTEGGPDFLRHRIQDIIGVDAAGGLPGLPSPAEKNMMLAVYKAPGGSNPGVEIHSNRCSEPNVITLFDTDGDIADFISEPEQVTRAGGQAGDGRYARIIDVMTFNDESADDALSCNGDEETGSNQVGIGVNQEDTIIMRTIGATQASATVRETGGSSTRMLEAPGGRVLGPRNSFAVGQERPSFAEITSKDENLYSKGRDVVRFQSRSITDGVPRTLLAFETTENSDIFSTTISYREPSTFTGGAPPTFSVKLTQGTVVTDTLVPGALGDRCSEVGRVVIITDPADISTGGAMGCVQVDRTLTDGSVQTIAFEGDATVTLTGGFLMSTYLAEGGGRCRPGIEQLAFAVPFTSLDAPATLTGPFNCAEIDIGEAAPLVIGEPWPERLDARVTAIMTNGLRISDPFTSGLFGDTCQIPTAGAVAIEVPGPIMLAGTLTDAKNTIFTCIQLNSFHADGSPRTYALDIRDEPLVDEDPVMGGPDPSTDCSNSLCRHEEDPVNITFFRSYVRSDEGVRTGSNPARVCDPIPIGGAARVQLKKFGDSKSGLEGENIFPAFTGPFSCVHIEMDPVEPYPRSTEYQLQMLSEGEAPDREPAEDAPGGTHSLGQRKWVTATAWTSARHQPDTSLNEGPLGDSCSDGTEVARMPFNAVTPSIATGLVNCITLNSRQADGASISYGVPIPSDSGAVKLRLTNGIPVATSTRGLQIDGSQGIGSTCFGPTLQSITFTGSGAATLSPAAPLANVLVGGVPTCVEVSYGADPVTSYAIGYDRRDGNTVLVRSDLQRNPLPSTPDSNVGSFPEDTSRNTDGIRITGKGTVRYSWYDTQLANVQIQRDPVGANGLIEIRVTGDDILTRRVFDERHETLSSTQQTFTLRQPYVPGSEQVYRNKTEIASNNAAVSSPTDSHTRTNFDALSAAEAPSDRNRDGNYDCGTDGDFERRGGTSGACGDLAPDGVASNDCRVTTGTGTTACPQPPAHKWTYEYRFAYHPNPVSPSTGCSPHPNQPCQGIYQYTRPSLNQIRTGAPVCNNPTGEGCLDADGRPRQDAQGNPIPEVITVDYTPAKQPVTVISAGETETVDLTWDDTINPPGYRGFIPVEVVRGLNNDRIYVQGVQASISVRYDDQFGADGRPSSSNPLDYRAVSATTLWRTGQDGIISFHTPNFQGTVTNVFGSAVPVQVMDADADRTDQLDAVVIRAEHATNQGQFVRVNLRETGFRTGIFRGYVSVAASPSPLDPPEIRMPTNGGTIRVIYEDPAGASGVPTTTFLSVPWLPAQTAGTDQIELYKAQARTSANRLEPTLTDVTCAGSPHKCPTPRIVGENEALFITVRDADANTGTNTQEKIKVTVFSSAELGGEEFELTERPGSPGVFDSQQISFERTLGRGANNNGNNLVFARFDKFQRDDVWVRYHDLNTLAGGSQFQESVRINWQRTHDGVVDVEHSNYVGTFTDGVTEAGTRAFGSVIVSDQDCNADPVLVDTILNTGTPLGCNGANRFVMAKIPAGGGNPLPYTTPAITTLVETGANTGVFMAAFSFGACTGTGSICNGRPVLAVANDDKIRASWADPLTVGGGVATPAFFDEAQWNQKGFGVISFDQTAYTDVAQQPTLQLIDSHLNTALPAAAKVDTVTVNVDTDAMSAPIAVTLTETGLNTGIFERVLSLSQTTSNAGTGQVHIELEDTIVVSYADANPPGTRSRTALVNLLDKAPPVTTLKVAPGAQLGENGVYRTAPTISFEATDQSAIKEIGFKIGASSVFTLFTQPIVLQEGRHVIQFRSIDALNQEEVAKTQIVEVDLTNPTQVPTNFQATPIAGGQVRLNWTGVNLTTDPFEFWEYVVFRDGGQTAIGNSTTNEFIDTTVADEISHSYQVLVEDKAGRRASPTASRSAVPDATLPSLTSATVNPGTFDVRDKPAGLNVSISAADLHLANVTAALMSPGQESFNNVTLVRGVNQKHAGTLDIDNVTQPCTCVVRFGAMDAAGNLAILDVPIVITGPDTLIPTITIPGPTLILGEPLIVTVTDNVGVTKVSYKLDDGVTVEVPIERATSTLTFQVPAALLPLGSHTLAVSAEDNATDENGVPTPNNASAILSFTVVVSDDGSGLPPSFFLPTTARVLGNGSILVEWEVPSSLVGISGFQVWRASSPFEAIATITDPGQRAFIDGTAESGTAYRYVATFFTSVPFSNLGQVPGYPGSDDAVQASAPITAGDDGPARWLWWVFGAIAFVAVIALLAILLANRRGGGSQQEQVYAPAPPPPEAEAETQEQRAGEQQAWAQTHRLRCPQCSHRFEVSGTKPIVTNCPNCGRKGILR